MVDAQLQVLIVDDEEEIRELFVSDFNKEFKHIFQAANGLEALTILETEHIDIIISDISMPKMNGIKLLEAVSKQKKEIPFVIVTAFADKEIGIAALHYGAHSVIEKPITSNALTKILGQVRDRINFKKQHLTELDDVIKEVLQIPNLNDISEKELLELRTVALQIVRANHLKSLFLRNGEKI